MRHLVTIVRVEPSPAELDGSVHFRIGQNEYEADTLCIANFRRTLGRTIEVELHADIEPPGWDADFRANDVLDRRIVQTGPSSYEGFGIVRSIEPITVDFGDLVFPMSRWTHDDRVIGAGVRVRIWRLHIWPLDTDSSAGV